MVRWAGGDWVGYCEGSQEGGDEDGVHVAGCIVVNEVDREDESVVRSFWQDAGCPYMPLQNLLDRRPSFSFSLQPVVKALCTPGLSSATSDHTRFKPNSLYPCDTRDDTGCSDHHHLLDVLVLMAMNFTSAD